MKNYFMKLFGQSKKITIIKKLTIKIISVVVFCCIWASIYMRATLFNIGFEYDEIFTAITTNPTLSFVWLFNHWLLADVHPPLYNAIMWGWNHLVPYGPELWLRLPSFVMGIGSLTLAWDYFPMRLGKTARQLFVSLLSCNLFIIAYSQHARSYMLMLLLAVPLTFLFVNFSYKINNHKNITLREWCLFGVLSVLLCWTHYFGALLFGTFSVVLLLQAWYYKRSLKEFILVPACVFVLFLPWLIPNLITQIKFQRFEGNWWANQAPYWHAWLTLFVFWASSMKGGLVMGGMLLYAGILCWKNIAKGKKLSGAYDLMVLGAAILVFLACVFLVSIKTYMFINRYFISLLPVLYLMFAIFFAPFFRKSIVLGLLFICFLLCGMGNFWSQHTNLLNNGDEKMPARKIGQIFRDRYPDKEMLVVAMESFPPETMKALYGFYVNQIYHLNMPVTELYYLNESARNEALSRPNTVVWMPNCVERKLEKLSLMWNSTIYVTDREGTACFLTFVPETQSTK